MENTYNMTSYQAPAAREIDLGFDRSFCVSGTHEGFSEEDWGEP